MEYLFAEPSSLWALILDGEYRFNPESFTREPPQLGDKGDAVEGVLGPQGESVYVQKDVRRLLIGYHPCPLFIGFPVQRRCFCQSNSQKGFD